MKVNMSKTEYECLNEREVWGNSEDTSIEVEEVTEFKYLEGQLSKVMGSVKER